MDYAAARERLIHGTTKKEMSSKWVGHKRLLIRTGTKNWPVGELPDEEEAITLQVYGVPILAWGKSGVIILRRGGWRTQLTIRALNEFLPRDFRVSRWWPQNFWIVRTPTGARFFRENLVLSAEGWDPEQDFKRVDEEGPYDAVKYSRDASEYARELTTLFVQKKLSEQECCEPRCFVDIPGDDINQGRKQLRAVTYEHVKYRSRCPHLIREALADVPLNDTIRPTLWAGVGFRETAHLYKTPKTKQQEARRAHDTILGIDRTHVSLWQHRRRIWTALETRLLENLGCEIL